MGIAIFLVSVCVAALVFLLFATDVTSGTVIRKEHVEAGTWAGNPIGPSTYVSECWRLTLEKDQGLVRRGVVCVPREDWDRTSVGDFYDGPTR